MWAVPEWKENFTAFFWLMTTGLCLGAIGLVHDWAKRHRNKSLLWLMAPPVTVLAYEAWFFLKVLWAGFVRTPLLDWLIFIWAILTWYLVGQWFEYREHLKGEEELSEEEFDEDEIDEAQLDEETPDDEITSSPYLAGPQKKKFPHYQSELKTIHRRETAIARGLLLPILRNSQCADSGRW